MAENWYNSLPLRLGDFQPELIRPFTALKVPPKRGRGGETKPWSNGLYCLEDESQPYCRSFISYVHNAIHVSKNAFESLWAMGMNDDIVKPTFAMGMRVNRKQATFGAGYSFSGQKNTIFDILESAFPEAVRTALEDARARLHKEDEPRKLNGVHVNWYPNGNASVMPHADDEPMLVPDAPIFSYTLLESDSTPPRGFQMYTQDGKQTVADIPLFNGDLLVMGGEVQRHFKHGVKKTSAAAYATHRRINITVRAFR
jgi:hypothetical protein